MKSIITSVIDGQATLWSTTKLAHHFFKKIVLLFLILSFGHFTNYAQECTANYEFVDSCGLVKFTNASTSALGAINYYSWDFGDGSTSTAEHPIYQYPASGTYQVCLAIGSNGCVDTICQEISINLCSGPSCDGLELLCDDEIDVLFVLDNSGSIITPEFTQMTSIVQNTMSDIDSSYPNSLFSITHYSGKVGNEVIIEHDFSPKSAIASIVRPTFSGNGDDMNAALGGIKDALLAAPSAPSSPLITGSYANKRLGAKLFIIIFTDAFSGSGPIGPSESAMRPYTESNILKAAPHNANITLVHFQPTGATNSVSAAIASIGGTYLGVVDPNPGDTTNPTGPRQFIPANFGLTSINILPEFPVCDSTISDFPCDQLSLDRSTSSADSCCYGIDIINNIGPEISCLEVEVITPGWLFNTGSISTLFNWCSTPTNTLLCIEKSGGFPTGTTANALNHCFMQDMASPPSGNNYQVEYRWYCGDGDDKKLVCRDTLDFSCSQEVDDPCLNINIESVNCDPDNPYEYFVNFTVTNNSGFPATNIILENINPAFRFKDCLGSASSIFISISANPTPLLPGNTSNILCAKVVSSYPILSTTQVCFKAGIFGPTGCCHSPTEVCIDIESCCSPCAEIEVVDTSLNIGNAACCYSLDVVDSCGYQYFTKIETEILTPGVIFGYHALGGPDAANWNVPASSPTAISWAPNSGYVPYGTTADIIQFCLDNIDSLSQVPQKVLIKYYTQNSMGEDTLVCTDTLTTDCQPPVNNSCLEISQQNLTCNMDSSCYEYSFWVTNTSTAPFTADWLDVFINTPTGMSFPSPGNGTFHLSPAIAVGDSAFITTCIESSTFPTTASTIDISYRLRFGYGDSCCYESIHDTLDIPPCTCCEMNTVTAKDQGDCCQSLDVDVVCTENDLTKIELEVLTPGVIFGAHSTGGTNPTDWTNPTSSPKKIQWEHTSGTIPMGSYPGLINFCLDNIFYASQTPQQVSVKWITADMNGNDSIVCEKILTFDCDVPTDNKCIFIKDKSLSCNPDGSYQLASEVCNVSNPMDTADYLVLIPIHPTGTVFTPSTVSVNLPPASCYKDSLNITNIVPGDTLRFSLRLMNSTSTSSWCCFEGDTVEMVVPGCCCTDSIQFAANVNKGFTITKNSGNMITVQPVHNFDNWYSVSWDFGDGSTDMSTGGTSVSYTYSDTLSHTICMTVTGPGCGSISICAPYDPSSKCDPSIATNNSGLTPNGDSFNDVFDIPGIANCKNIKLQIYNRWGTLVYEQSNYETGTKWDGTSNRSQPLPQGTYFYLIDFIDEGVRKSGYLDIRR